MIYALATAAAALFVAAIVFEADAVGLAGRPGVQRANAWGF